MNSLRRLRRGSVAVTCVLFAGLSLTACSSQERPEDGSVVLNVWGAVPAENGPQALIDAFEADNPSTDVTYTQYVQDPAGNLKLDTALQGGAKIDVFFSYLPEHLSKRVDSKLAMDLTEIVADDPVLAPLKSTDVSVQFDGKLYSLPTNSAPAFVYVNKDMLDEAGIGLPTEWSEQEFREISQKLTAGDVHGSFRAPRMAEITLGPDGMYTQDGKANFTDPAWLADAELIAGMAEEGSEYPEDQVLSQQLNSYQQNVFVGETVGLWASDSYNFRFLNNEQEYPHDFITSFAPLPIPEGQEQAWNTGTFDNWISIAEQSKNKDAAVGFVKFWIGEGASHMISKAGKVSPLETDRRAVIDGLLGENPEERYDVEAFERVYFGDTHKLGVPTQNAARAEIVTAKNTLTSQLRLGEITPQQWVNSLQEQAEAAISRAQ